mgnify:CR=1 FL=1
MRSLSRSTRMRITPEQWAAATPLAAKLSHVSHISYEPEFSPHYDRAYAYMAPAYMLNEAVTKQVAQQAEGTVDEEEESSTEDDEDESSEPELTTEAKFALESAQKRRV